MTSSSELENTLNVLQKATKLCQEELDIVDIKERLKMLNFMDGQFYFIFDFLNLKYLYISDNANDMMGINIELVDKLGVVKFMQEFIHPDDTIYCDSMISQFMDYAKTQSSDHIKNLRALLSYRIKKKDGQYTRVLEQNSIVKVSHTGDVLMNFGSVSIMPLIPNSMSTAGAIIDISSGEQIMLLDDKTKEIPHLTKREKQIVGLIATGYMNKEIANKLYISLRTVETHRKNVIKKLEVKSPFELIWKAIQLNLILKDE